MPVTINGTTGIAGVDGSAATPAVQGSDTNTGIFYPAADTIAFGEGGTEAMRIDSSGNVGIGTSSPGARLHISGSGQALRAASTDTSTEVVSESISSATSKYAFHRVYNTNNGSNPIDYGVSNDGSALIINRAAPVTGTRAFTFNYGPVGDYLRIDTVGRVTTPYQPAFLATRNEGNLSTTGGETIIPMNYTVFNVGSNYNTSTYRFTAPVAGIYLFCIAIYNNSATTTRGDIYINGTRYTGGFYNVGNGGGSVHTVLANMNAGDYASPYLQSATATLFYGGASPHTFFSGFLVG